MVPVGWVMGALNFCFLWLFPSLHWRAEAPGLVWQCSLALSTQECMVLFGKGGLWAGTELL